MIPSNKRITNAQNANNKGADQTAPLLFANLQRQVFSHQGPNNLFHVRLAYFQLFLAKVGVQKITHGLAILKLHIQNANSKLKLLVIWVIIWL